MRVEPFSINSVVHVVKRGGRGMDIVRDQSDRWRFMKLLYLLNDTHQVDNLAYDIQKLPLFERPEHWPPRKMLTSVLGWTLMPNHFHLLLQEREEGGISKFMHRLGTSMTKHFNEKYEEQGSIFQGSYKSRTVSTDGYLRYVLAYIVTKNVFELYPKGFQNAVQHFDAAWQWSKSYPFSSLQTAAEGRVSPIVDMNACRELGLLKKNFKRTSKDMLAAYAERKLPPETVLE